MQAFLPFVPPTVTHNDLEAYTVKAKSGKVVAKVRKSDRLKDAEAMMLPYLQRMARSWSCVPLKPPVAETLKICWPTDGKHEQGELRIDPPDLDNWEKTWHDLVQRAGIVKDDAHIAYKTCMKVWADPGGVFVRFKEIDKRGSAADAGA